MPFHRQPPEPPLCPPQGLVSSCNTDAASGNSLVAAERPTLALNMLRGKNAAETGSGSPPETPQSPGTEQTPALENSPSGCHGSRSGMGAFIPMGTTGLSFLVDTDCKGGLRSLQGGL